MDIDHVVRRIKRFAPFRWLRQVRHEHQFWHSRNVMHLGVYQSFQDAFNAIPKERIAGWNHPEPAAMFKSSDGINPRDYPVLFWMRTLWNGNVTVFDYGGHIGHKRYAFEKYLAFDPSKQWIVCDVPAVIDEGRRIAEQRNPLNLSFTTDFERANDATVLLCLGVLQFLEKPLADLLGHLRHLPPHIIANGVPLHPHFSYVTLVNNAGNGYCPYRVFCRDAFITSIESLGYRLSDQWINVEKGCYVSVHEELDVAHYSGLYFRRM